METKDLYAKKLAEEFKGIKQFGIETDEHKRVVGDITNLTGQYVKLREIDIEEEKLGIERVRAEADAAKVEIEKQKQEFERIKIETERAKVDVEKQRLAFEKKKSDDDLKARLIGIAVDVLKTGATIGLSAISLIALLRLEETGTIASKTGNTISRNLLRW